MHSTNLYRTRDHQNEELQQEYLTYITSIVSDITSTMHGELHILIVKQNKRGITKDEKSSKTYRTRRIDLEQKASEPVQLHIKSPLLMDAESFSQWGLYTA